MKTIQDLYDRIKGKKKALPSLEEAAAAAAAAAAPQTEPIAPISKTDMWRDAERLHTNLPLAMNAPTSPQSVVLETLETLAANDGWLQIATYLQRLPENARNAPQLNIWRAIALFKYGERKKGRTAIFKAVRAAGEYRVSAAAVATLQRHVDVVKLLDRAIQDLKEGKQRPNGTIFALGMLFHQGRFTELDALMTQVAPQFDMDPEFLLLWAHVKKKIDNKDMAATYAFKAREVSKRSLRHDLACIDMALHHPSDSWIESAFEIGIDLMNEEHQAKRYKRIFVSMTRLCNRLMDDEIALAYLDHMAALPDLDEDLIFTLVRSYFLKGQFDRAHQMLDARLADNPANRPALMLKAGLLAAAARTDEAVNLLQTTIPAFQYGVEFNGAVGHILAWAGQTEAARPYLQKVLREDPENASAVADLAFCAEMRQEYPLSLTLMDRASVLFEIGIVQRAMGLDLMHQPRLRRRMIFTASMAGQTELAASLQHEAMLQRHLDMPYPFTEWQGGSVAGKSVVALAELGIGDEIRYASVYPRLLRDAKSVMLTCDPRLQPLFARSFPGFDVVPVQREFPGLKAKRLDERTLAVTGPMRKLLSDDVITRGRDADVWMRVMHQFECDALVSTDVPAGTDRPVLVPEPGLADDFTRKLGQAAKRRKVIGLSWRGGRRTYSRDSHYYHLEQWEPILRDTDACFVNLQYAIEEAEMDWLRSTLGDRFIELPDLDLFDDMEGVAALCSQLDLVIAICTNVLELAAGVGTPCLYLMRSPQVTHAIRLQGPHDRHGTRQDSVWHSSRILPRFDMTDAQMIDIATAYTRDHLAAGGTEPVHVSAP